MIEKLRIQNLAVVEDVTLTFGSGLNVLSGSTGAGKSLILGAVNLLLGARGTPRAIRSGQDKAIVECVFGLGQPLADKLLSFLPGGGANKITLRREVDRSGRSRAFVNDRAVTIKQLHDVSVRLIEPHGQNEQLQLKSAENHVVYLDKFASNSELSDKYRIVLEEFHKTRQELDEFERRLALAKEKRELLEHRVEEITRAAIRPGERQELEESIGVLEKGQEIFEALRGAGELIYDSDVSAASLVGQAKQAFSGLEGLDPKLAALVEQLASAEILLTESNSDIRAYLERLEFEPGELEKMQERLDFLLGLERRYGVSADDLLHQAEKWGAELESLEFEDDHRSQLIETRDRALSELCAAGAKLSKSRRDAAKILDRQVTTEIEQLMLKGARFRTDFTFEPDDKSEIKVKGQRIRAQENGFDVASFYVRTNPGEAEGSVAEVASSGELSRIALAIKSVVNLGREGSVLVFDELDAGVGADMGEIMATKLQSLAANYQIVCITHMPQIAASASNHLVVKKSTKADRTYTSVATVDLDERVDEIARMLGGSEGSKNRLELAREMLQSRSKRVSRMRP